MDLGLGFHGLGRIHIVRQHAIGHDNRFRRSLGLFAGFGNDNGHLVAHKADLAAGQNGMGAGLHARAILGMDHPAADQAADLVFLDFLGGEHIDHARHFLGLGGVDRLDRGMGMGAAHEIGVGLVFQVDVVGILALAREETACLPCASPARQFLCRP